MLVHATGVRRVADVEHVRRRVPGRKAVEPPVVGAGYLQLLSIPRAQSALAVDEEHAGLVLDGYQRHRTPRGAEQDGCRAEVLIGSATDGRVRADHAERTRELHHRVRVQVVIGIGERIAGSHEHVPVARIDRRAPVAPDAAARDAARRRAGGVEASGDGVRGDVDLHGVAVVRRGVAVARDGHVEPAAGQVDRAPHVLLCRSEDAGHGPARQLRAGGEIERVHRAVPAGDVHDAGSGTREPDGGRAPDPVDPVGQVEAVRLYRAEVLVPERPAVARP